MNQLLNWIKLNVISSLPDWFTVNAPPPSNPLPAVSVIVASFAPPPDADELIKYPSLLEFIVTFVPGSKEPLINQLNQ